ncbi:MAG: ribosome small subunit-dependent GTPase A [Gammaproteobacteria bacterium]
MNLILLGWNAKFQETFDNLKDTNLIPARIISEDKGSYVVMTATKEIRSKISGAYFYTAKTRIDLPVVGDWVAIQASGELAIIHTLLPRNTLLSRKASGENTEEQPLAANIDYVFIISGLDKNYNLRRIERYITLAWNSGAQPIIILNKVDLVNDNEKLDQIAHDIEAIACSLPVHFISSLNNEGLSALSSYFSNNKTVALLGSSGVGKSTLTNTLLGEVLQKTTSTRESDSKGRHTTTRRQLFQLSDGGMLIDTPGMRELQLWVDENTIDSSFSDIETLATNCRFRDCTHSHEVGCAVQEAIAQNTLSKNRLSNYLKMQREAKYLSKRQKETSWDTRLEDRKFGKRLRNARKHLHGL